MVINIAEPIFETQTGNDKNQILSLLNLTGANVTENQLPVQLELEKYRFNIPVLINQQNGSVQNDRYWLQARKEEQIFSEAAVQCSNCKDVSFLESVKRAKKKRIITICTSNCKYEVVKKVATLFGMKEVSEDSNWNLCWTDTVLGIDRIKDVQRFQKVNHFPGMSEIYRKDFLARNLKRMVKLFPKDYNFFPKTWCFPAE